MRKKDEPRWTEQLRMYQQRVTAANLTVVAICVPASPAICELCQGDMRAMDCNICSKALGKEPPEYGEPVKVGQQEGDQ